MAALVVLTAGWAWVLLDRTATFAPWVRWSVVVVGVIAAVALLLPRRTSVIASVALVATVVSGLLGPAAYAVQTVATAKTGSIPLAGPSTGNGFGGFGGPGGQRGDRTARDRDRGTAAGGAAAGGTTAGGTAAGGTAAGGAAAGGAGSQALTGRVDSGLAVVGRVAGSRPIRHSSACCRRRARSGPRRPSAPWPRRRWP